MNAVVTAAKTESKGKFRLRLPSAALPWMAESRDISAAVTRNAVSLMHINRGRRVRGVAMEIG